MSQPASSGIKTTSDGQSFIPSSRRADGSTRKEIKVRPGYKPPEDVETYKSRNAEALRSKSSYVPGTEPEPAEELGSDTKSKNAKRREAARKKKEMELNEHIGESLNIEVSGLQIKDKSEPLTTLNIPNDQDLERQKKIRNTLKKLKAVRELKAKKLAGEKLTTDQVVKMSKEQEILRDLAKLDYDGPEIRDDHTESRAND